MRGRRGRNGEEEEGLSDITQFRNRGWGAENEGNKEENKEGRKNKGNKEGNNEGRKEGKIKERRKEESNERERGKQ